MAKRTPENNRRKIIEEQRRKARAAERRKTVLTIVLSTLLGAALIGGSVYFSVQSKKKKDVDIRTVGVSKEAAACLDPKEEQIPDPNQPNSVKHTARDGDHVDYPQSPPTSGRHNPTPLPGFGQKFYSREANPPPERAVHNLEHGYEVVWYDKTVPQDQIELLKQAGDAADDKILIVPWDRADFPDGKHVVLTAWGERQQCSGVSGAVIKEFYDKFAGPNGRAPEKGSM